MSPSTTPVQQRIEYLVTNGRGYHDSQERFTRMDRHDLEMEAFTANLFLQEVNSFFEHHHPSSAISTPHTGRYEWFEIELDDADWDDFAIELEEMDYD